MEYKIEDLTKEDAAYIGGKINEIVPHEVDADEEEFVLKIENENGGIIAVIAQKLFSLHDKYCIDIYRPEYEKEVVAILITLQHMIRDRENSRSSFSAFSSSSSS